MIPSFFCRSQFVSKPPIVCVIAGDDAAPEVLRPSVEILRKLAPDIHFVEALSGREAQEHYGDAFPDDTREKIDAADCTLFGASGGPSRAVLWYLRWGKETFVNVRPVQWYPGYRSPYPPREGDVGELDVGTSL